MFYMYNLGGDIVLGRPIDAEKELGILDRINWWQRWILINSIIYYEYDYNMCTDREYDDTSRKLVELMSSNIELAKTSNLWYIYSTFDGTTGFDLYHNLTDSDKEYFNGYARHCVYYHRARHSPKSKSNTKSKR